MTQSGAVPGAPPPLDAVQREAVTWPRSRGNVLVLGAAGTGKSRVAVEAAVHRALEVAAAGRAGRADGGVLLLSPQRLRADALALELTGRLAPSGAHVEVRTPSGLAFEIVRRRALARGNAAPVLLSGAEVDAILANLLAGHEAGAGADPRWEATPVRREALGLTAFREELRDLLTRAAQEGLTPAELAAHGRELGRPEWVSAAVVMREYEETLALRDEQGERQWHYDHARAMTEAAHHLATWRDALGEDGPHWSAVVVDDYQDATPGLTALLRRLTADGAQLVLTANPDVAVEQFRGGSAHLPGESLDPADAAHPLGLAAHPLHLPTAHRGGAAQHAAVTRLAAHLPPTRTGATHRRALEGSCSPGAASAPGAPGEPGQAGARALPADPGARSGCAGVHLAVVGSSGDEGALIARRLREEHLLAGTPWGAMAVLVRRSGDVARLRSALRAADVPTESEGPALALRDEPAVRPLLDVLDVAMTFAAGGQVPVDQVRGLLQSAVGGLSSVQVRLLVRSAAVLGDEEGGEAGLVAAVRDPEAVFGVQIAALTRYEAEQRARRAARPGAGGGDARGADDPATAGAREGVLLSAVRGLLRVAGAVRAARSVLADPRASASAALWAAWDHTGLAGLWQTTALAGGPGAERAHADLDAVLALFAAAERHDERATGQGVTGFLATIEEQDVPQDTLAARGVRGQAVTVETAASAAGREWDVVAVAGVQEEAWPDMRIRDTLLGAVDLVDVVRRGSAGRRSAPEKRREVLEDELRLFLAALTRARCQVLVTAVADGQDAPSMFVEALAGGVPLEEFEVAVPEPLTLRGLVGTLRRAAETGAAAAIDDPGSAEPSTAQGREAVELLTALRAQGVAWTDPAGWKGYAAASTQQPLVPAGERVRVSPSAVAGAQECALRWLLTRHGGEAGSTTAATLGTLIHAIAQEHELGGREELRDALDRALPSLGYDRGTWVGRRAVATAEAMVERLAGFLEARAAELGADGADPAQRIRTEVPIPDVDVGQRARIAGRADRLELLGGEGEGRRWRVVDFKTGKSAMSAADALRDPQLALYQVGVRAIEDANHEPLGQAAGAELVYLGTGAAATRRTQEPLGDAEDPVLPEGRFTVQEAEALIDQAARIMGGAEFRPSVGQWCRTCPVMSVCPLGAQAQEVAR